MLKVVADDKIPFLKGVLEKYAKVVYLPGGKIAKSDLIDADALLVRTRTRCDASTLEGTTVKFVATATIGYDHIDTGYCQSKGIRWTNAPGCNSASVAQYMASTLLSFSLKSGFKLQGATLGVIGVGNVGSKVAKVGRALGMKVLLNDPPRERTEGAKEFCSLDTVLAEADIVTIHVPLTSEGPDKTYHLGEKGFFEKLAKSPFLVNSSRGEVVSGPALKEALAKGQVRAAALDVWENEPDIDLALMAALFQATPHIAGYSTDGKANGTAMSVHALARLFNLPLLDFFPSNVPEAPTPVIELEQGASFEETVFKAVSSSYDVRADDARLRAKPSDFEKQRGDDPLRREFPAYSIKAKGNLNADVLDALEKLGFKSI